MCSSDLIGDVGWNTSEEIDRLANPTDATIENFGWPCYEGNVRQPSWDAAGLNLCESLYTAGSGAVVQPSFTYNHNERIDPNDTCAFESTDLTHAPIRSSVLCTAAARTRGLATFTATNSVGRSRAAVRVRVRRRRSGTGYRLGGSARK